MTLEGQIELLQENRDLRKKLDKANDEIESLNRQIEYKNKLESERIAKSLNNATFNTPRE